MFDIGAYLAQFSETWNLFIRWKLPAFIDDNEDGRFGLIDGKPALARIMMPLVGAVMGICLYLPLWGITAVFGHVAGAIAAAVFAPPVIELATGWTGLSSLATYFQLRRAGASQEEALFARPQSMTEPRPPVSMIGMLTIYVLRMVRQKRRAAEIRMQITCAVGRHRLVPAVGGNGKAVALVKLFRNVPVLIAVVMKKLMRQTDQSVNSWHHAGNHKQTESRDQDFPVVFQRAFLQKRI